jgi:hypothetical protein
MLREYIIASMRSTFPAHLLFLNVITSIILGENAIYEIPFYMCNFLRPPATSAEVSKHKVKAYTENYRRRHLTVVNMVMQCTDDD